MQDRTLIPAKTDRTTSAAPVQEIKNRWALLVGVDGYVDRSFNRLNFCVKDVLSLSHSLEQLGYTVVCLHDQLDAQDARFPTFSNIEAELTHLCRNVGSNDLLWVHFACHGTLLNQQPVLIAQNTRHIILESTAVPLAKVENLMRGSKAKRLVLTLDACHTGVERGRDLADPAFIKNAYELAEGFALIAASTAQQAAQECPEVEHGVFTYYILEGLTGKADQSNKGFISVQDLQTYVVDNLRRWNVKHGGQIQEPTYRAEGIGDMILGDYRQHKTPDAEMPPVPSTPTATGDRSPTNQPASAPGSSAPDSSAPGSPSSTVPSPIDLVKQGLESRYQVLVKEYAAVNTQLSYSTGAEAVRLQRQAEVILQEMTEIYERLTRLAQQ